MRFLLFILLFTLSLSAKNITPNEVYAQTILIQNHVHFLLKHYGYKHNHKKDLEKGLVSVKFKPRNAWQKAYEVLVKINILRISHGYPRIEPIGMEPVENLNPDMVYEMTQRILAEIEIFEVREDIKVPTFELKTFKNKTPVDVYNSFTTISTSFNQLNRSDFSPNYVFSQAMRIYDDLTIILNKLDIKDDTIPDKIIQNATSRDSLIISMKFLSVINKLQRDVGIETVDFSTFSKDKDVTPSDVYTITGMILSELQTIKAYIGLVKSVTPPPLIYMKKVPANIEQLMSWNLRKLELIHSLSRGK